MGPTGADWLGASMVRRLIAVVSGMLFAALTPALAYAADGAGDTSFEAASRALDPTTDWSMIVLVTFLALGALFLLSAIGYMYRRERGLDWEFQKPDAPHDDHH